MTFLTPVTPRGQLRGQMSCHICGFVQWLLWPSFIKIGSMVHEICSVDRKKKERRTQEKQDTSVCNGCVTRVRVCKQTLVYRRTLYRHLLSDDKWECVMSYELCVVTLEVTSWPSMTLNDLLNNLVCVECQTDRSYQISAQLEHFVLNRKWPHNDPLMTLNDVLSILTCLDRLEDHSHQISAQ